MTQIASAPRTDFRSALIVEDHPLFCDALAMTLQAVAGIEVVAHADRLAEALALIAGETGQGSVARLEHHVAAVRGLVGAREGYLGAVVEARGAAHGEQRGDGEQDAR